MTVDAEVVLAGALGSVGEKIVARQADKVTAEFRNLERVLMGDALPPPSRPAARLVRPVGGGCPGLRGAGCACRGGE